MLAQIVIPALAALVLAGCGAINCGAAGDDSRADGGCRAHTTF